MHAQSCCRFVAVFLLFGAVCSVSLLGPVMAAPPPSAGAGRPAASAPAIDRSSPAAVPADAAGKPVAGEEKEKSLREQTIYIPYEKLRKMFEKEGRGVFLPYEKFRELWQAAQEKKAAAPDQKPPVAAVITESENEATVSKDVVRVKAVLKIELLKEGWNEVPLRLADAAITAATIAGQPARIVAAGGEGYKLLVEKKGKNAEQIDLTLHYAKTITKSPGQNSVSFEAPQTAVSRWKVRIPEAGVKINLQPLIAATEITSADESKPKTEKPNEEPKRETPKKKPAEDSSRPLATNQEQRTKNVLKKEPAAGPNETVLLAFVGAAPNVRIDWTPKSEGATGLEALASVQAEQQVTVGEAVTRTRVQLAYPISRAELRQLAIETPADQKVVNVFDPNIRQWSVEPAGAAERKPAEENRVQKILVQLFEPAKTAQNVTVELEKFVEESAKGTPGVKPSPAKAAAPILLAVPVVKAAGVGRQQGVVVVRVAEGLRAEAARSAGLLQMDAAELPPALARGQWAFSYRYSSVPFDLQLSVEKIQPRINVESIVEAELQPERLSLDLLAIYDIERAGVFQLELDVPTGFDVRQVRGRAAAGAGEVQVDAHHLEGKEKTRLVVNLARKAIGKVGLAVELSKELKEADLLAPTGKAAQVPLPIPQIAKESVERAAGRLVIHAPESLEVNPGKPEGLRSISFKEALEGLGSARQGKTSDARPVLAYAYAQEPTMLVLQVERRKPQVSVGQLLEARVEEGTVKCRDMLAYDIRYSGVKTLRLDVPADLAGKIQITTPGIRKQAVEPAPADLTKGYVAWNLAAERDLFGERKIEFSWQTPLGHLATGARVPLSIPKLRPMNVDRAWGQIVLAKAETIDLRDEEDPQSPRPIDPQHDLMPGAALADAALAFEFHDDNWVLKLDAVRYQLEEIKHTSIERALLRMVVTRAEKIAVQALYRMRSAEQRLAVELPEGAEIDVQPRINGRSVTLETEDKGRYFVPLVDCKPEEPFLLELRYTVPGNGSRLAYPDFPDPAPAVQEVDLAVYLPQEWVLLGKGGPWTEQSGGTWSGQLGLSNASAVPNPMNLQDREQQIRGAFKSVSLTDFPVDGRIYLFSALQPAPSKDGALRLTTIRESWLNGLLFTVIIVGGVLLLPTRAGTRAVAVGVLIIGLVLCGVFLPLFARQILGGSLAAAICVVLVIWTTVFAWSAARRVSWKFGLGGTSPGEVPATPFGPEPAGAPGCHGQLAARAEETLAGKPPVAPGESAPVASKSEPAGESAAASDASESNSPKDNPETEEGGPSHA